MNQCVVQVVVSVFLYFYIVQAQPFLFRDDIAELHIFSASLNGSLNFFNVWQIDRKLPVKMLVHGYRQHNTDYLFSVIVNNYVEKGNVSMITVDYPQLAFSSYEECYFGIPEVEKYIAEFIRLLNFLGIPPGNVHLIGHSLGAQMVGRMGNIYTNLTNGRKLGRISSLDPPKMGFASILVKPYYKITNQSAEIVDIIHTDTKTIGVTEPSGTIDFYANHGYAPQPGCDDAVNLRPLIDNIPLWDGWIIPYHGKDVCSHARSLQLFAQSIVLSDALVGLECLDWDIQNRMCLTPGTKQLIYGEDMPRNATGVYYFNTTATPPYTSI
ncbi:pancreatic triacylglycerol lipase-like [Atheta coriaria]|uniref:pancreatic triacylglycerol lipase-like n=1 Tax=Dalotia coriaria TaxID=877792 RepID=UPI0031F45026